MSLEWSPSNTLDTEAGLSIPGCWPTLLCQEMCPEHGSLTCGTLSLHPSFCWFRFTFFCYDKTEIIIIVLPWLLWGFLANYGTRVMVQTPNVQPADLRCVDGVGTPWLFDWHLTWEQSCGNWSLRLCSLAKVPVIPVTAAILLPGPTHWLGWEVELYTYAKISLVHSVGDNRPTSFLPHIIL